MAHEAYASYTCRCKGCGRKLTRKHKTYFKPDERGSAAWARAAQEASVLEGNDNETCRECAEAAPRFLLIEMASKPDDVFPEPKVFWDSAMHALLDRKQVQHAFEKCDCKSACCSGYKNLGGYRVTEKGIQRARKFKETADV